MTPIELIKQCQQSGVTLGMDAEGRLTFRGDQEAVSRLLPVLRRHKPGLLAILAGKAVETQEATEERFSQPAVDDVGEVFQARAAILQADADMNHVEAESEKTASSKPGATLAKLEAAANLYCDAVGDDAERRAVMLADVREFPPQRWSWLIEYLNQVARIEQATRGTAEPDDRRR